MKICLINPERFSAYQAPLGLAYLASYLQKYDEDSHEIKILDENAGDDIEKELSRLNPDLVGITSTTPQISRSMNISNFIKSNLPETLVVIGGVHPTVLPKQTLIDGSFDMGIVGEGEITFFELVQLLKNKKLEPASLKKINGLCFRDDEKIILTEQRPLMQNLDIVPFPARELLNMDYYLKSRDVVRGVLKRSTQMMSSRGCPYNCAFCASFVINRRRFRMHSAEYVINEVEHLINKYKVEAIYFADDNFVVNKDRAREICNLMINKGFNEKIVWSVQMRSDWVSEKDMEFLRLLKKAGCIQTEFGFESGSPRILSFLKKNTTTVETNSRAIKLCKEVGLRVFGNFMIGVPGETLEDIQLTKKFILRHDIDSMGIFPATPLPGTELWDVCKEKGLLEGLKWDDLKMNVRYRFRSFSDIFSQDELMKIYRDMTSIGIERYPLKFKLIRLLSNPRFFSLVLPYLSYKTKRILGK